jgi:carbon monoxide dehydrogenase subunit G
VKLEDSVVIPRSREAVWRALRDPDILRQAIPGCDELEQVSPENMKAKVTLKVGPIKATFAGGVTLSEINAPESYVLSGEGKGGVAGFAKGAANVRLEEQDEGTTVLHYDVTAQVGGKIAQLGSRLLDSTAKRLARQFFDDFSKLVSAPAETGAGEAA